MGRTGGKRGGRRSKNSSLDDSLVPSLSELKRDKHRHCESKRRQQENAAIDNLKSFLVSSKRYKFDIPQKLDRLQLLSAATMYIQENVSTLNILVGVLCNTLVHSPELQKTIESLKTKEDVVSQQALLDALQVPYSSEELLDKIIRERSLENPNAPF
ncbi:hypothetical protein WA588_004471 [Blastocystis sp. NMH]